MTTEEDFQRALDREPDDWQTRLVFADWLQEHGDPRAEGYRALGLIARWPVSGKMPDGTRYVLGNSDRARPKARKWKACIIPADWFALLVHPREALPDLPWNYYTSRREAEDAAALAFAKLPAERRAELLHTEVPPS
jgi:uncharacterized protein (TIGR02996 family)